MFEQLPAGKPAIFRGYFWAGVVAVATLIGSMVVVQKLWPKEAEKVRAKIEKIFLPPQVKKAEAPKELPRPKGSQRPLVRVFSSYNPYAPPREVPKEIALDVPEVYVPPNARMGDLPTAPSCPPGANCVFGNELVPVALVSPPPPPQESPRAPEPPKRISVSTGVQAAKLVSQPRPQYPELARKARIQGTVRLTAIIGKDGSIQSLQVVSGHPLLIQTAIGAVRMWRYDPTLLNGEPVEVITQIDVNFTLTQ